MPVREIVRDDWDKFTSMLSHQLRTERVRMASGGLERPQMVEADHMTLRGITWDRRSNVLEFECEGFVHRISKPARIRVEVGDDGFQRMEVVDEDGNARLLELERAVV